MHIIYHDLGRANLPPKQKLSPSSVVTFNHESLNVFEYGSPLQVLERFTTILRKYHQPAKGNREKVK